MENTAIITYGSLLHPDELETSYRDVEFVEIKLYGYIRHFGQKSTFRYGENGERGVSTIEPANSDEWVSALLITGLTEDEYEEYIERESGYRIETVDASDIEFYDEEWPLDKFDEILVPIGTRPLENPDPIPSYVRLCTIGAFEHSDEFGRDFVLTTHWSK